MHNSGTARSIVSFSGVILNNSEPSRMYFSASAPTLLVTNLEEVLVYFVTKYKYRVFEV